MITVWKDGTWKEWTARDAELAANDLDWLVNIDIPIGVTEEMADSALLIGKLPEIKQDAAPAPEAAGESESGK